MQRASRNFSLYTDPSVGKVRSPPAYFILDSFDWGISPLDKALVGVQSENSTTGTPQCLHLAKHWLREYEKHSICRHPLSGRGTRPKRLVKLWKSDERLRARVCRGVPSDVRYATLSHRWGPHAQHCVCWRPTLRSCPKRYRCYSWTRCSRKPSKWPGVSVSPISGLLRFASSRTLPRTGWRNPPTWETYTRMPSATSPLRAQRTAQEVCSSTVTHLFTFHPTSLSAGVTSVSKARTLRNASEGTTSFVTPHPGT